MLGLVSSSVFFYWNNLFIGLLQKFDSFPKKRQLAWTILNLHDPKQQDIRLPLSHGRGILEYKMPFNWKNWCRCRYRCTYGKALTFQCFDIRKGHHVHGLSLTPGIPYLILPSHNSVLDLKEGTSVHQLRAQTTGQDCICFVFTVLPRASFLTSLCLSCLIGKTGLMRILPCMDGIVERNKRVNERLLGQSAAYSQSYRGLPTPLLQTRTVV